MGKHRTVAIKRCERCGGAFILTALAVALADALDTIRAANGGASLRQLAELSECLGR